MQSRTYTSVAVAALMLSSAAAFADSSSARVRVTHASPDAPAVDIFVDGAEAFDSVSFGETTMYAELPAGTYNVQVAAAANNNIVVIDTDLTLIGGKDYTVAAIDLLAQIEPLGSDRQQRGVSR